MGGKRCTGAYSDEDYLRFSHRLHAQLPLLAQRLRDPALDLGPASVGAELELYLTDSRFQPLNRNDALCRLADDPLLQRELNRFNLEYNLPPRPLAGTPFTDYADLVQRKLQQLGELAATLPEPGRILAIGILPTLTAAHLQDCMSDEPRYHGLADGLRRIRGEPFQIHIEGPHERLDITSEDVTLEGANTSWQFHLRVPASAFADWYNAIQLATPLVVGFSSNSPLLFGQALWEETRIALFRQSIDSRSPRLQSWRPPARVAFGEGWLREGAWELFASAVALYPPLLPDCSDAPAEALAELRQHMGTVWLWNRPIYDPADGGHLRIEMRAQPAGPTGLDMVAGSAFLIGLANHLRPHMKQLTTALPFRYAEYNFVEAARHGIAARLVWPGDRQVQLADRPLTDIFTQLLPAAHDGLLALGVDATEADFLCQLLQARIESRQTGSRWLRSGLQRLGGTASAAQALLHAYHQQQASGRPVHEWELP